MNLVIRTVVTFTSSYFNTTEPKDYFINPCCFGDDVAKWLIEQFKDRGVDTDENPGLLTTAPIIHDVRWHMERNFDLGNDVGGPSII